jgi:MarR family transcriptional regulator, organic hydroperoxide resistance regulator
METEHIIALVSVIRDKANKFISKQLKAHGIEDLAPAHGVIFVHLFSNYELTMGEIAQLIDRDKSTVTTLVKKLTALGYTESERDTTIDNRVTRVRLTAKGKALEPAFNEISSSLMSKVYAGFSELDKDIIIKLLSQVKNNF